MYLFKDENHILNCVILKQEKKITKYNASVGVDTVVKRINIFQLSGFKNLMQYSGFLLFYILLHIPPYLTHFSGFLWFEQNNSFICVIIFQLPT